MLEHCYDHQHCASVATTVYSVPGTVSQRALVLCPRPVLTLCLWHGAGAHNRSPELPLQGRLLNVLR